MQNLTNGDAMLDAVDKKLIEVLNKDGRINNNEIARKLSISDGTVRNRIKKLADSGHLKVIGLLNPESRADKQMILLGVKACVTKDLMDKAKEISMLNGVQSVCITTGRYDFIIEVWVDVEFGLVKFLSESLASVEGIASSESFLVIKSYNKWISKV